MHRRKFIQGSLLASALSGTAAKNIAATAGAAEQPRGTPRIDTNITLFQWPFRRLSLDSPAAMLAKLEEHYVTQAWAGSFEGILHRDIAGVNQRLADACRDSRGRLLPFGSINLTLPNWEEDVRRCHEIHRMPGVRLHPNYHGYTLADPQFKRLLIMATERGLLVQIALLMEDTRTQHPLLVVKDVDATPLPDVMKEVPKARVLLLNSAKAVDGPLFAKLTATPGITYDIARVESAAGVGKLLRRSPAGRMVFGTHAPFFIYESALIKLYESELSDGEMRALMAENPQRLLHG
jgi:predicted TIM-barrel fold metal-dependent hydrolase